MSGVLASIRPDDWNVPLLLHVLGAMVLVGAAVTAVVALLAPGRGVDPAPMRRIGFRVLLFVALPAWIVMRVAAQWIHSKEFGDADEDPAWVGIGFITSEAGGLLLLAALVCSGLAARRSSSGLGKAAGVVTAVALAAWIVAVWAMGAKPA
jgi:hypothetical protein